MAPCLVGHFRITRNLTLCRESADGVLCSANVPRPAASSFISLRRARHRRILSVLWFHNDAPPLCPVPRMPGISRSEIKEEPKAGDIRGGMYPASSARTPNTTSTSTTASGNQP
jgi:hypothetical protein